MNMKTDWLKGIGAFNAILILRWFPCVWCQCFSMVFFHAGKINIFFILMSTPIVNPDFPQTFTIYTHLYTLGKERERDNMK